MLRWTAALALALAFPLETPKETRLAAYEKGLAFLRSKAVEGKWGPPGKADPGVTALAVSAFLERPGGADPKDRALVDGAAAWLRSMQKPDGGIYDQGHGHYTTSLAVQVLVLHGTAEDGAAVEKAKVYLKRMQFCEEGGEGRTVDRKDQKPDTVVLKIDDEQSLRWVLGQGRSVVLRKDR